MSSLILYVVKESGSCCFTTFTLMHWCMLLSKATHTTFNAIHVFQRINSLGIKPTTLALLAPRSTVWTTGITAPIIHQFDLLHQKRAGKTPQTQTEGLIEIAEDRRDWNIHRWPAWLNSHQTRLLLIPACPCLQHTQNNDSSAVAQQWQSKGNQTPGQMTAYLIYNHLWKRLNPISRLLFRVRATTSEILCLCMCELASVLH